MHTGLVWSLTRLQQLLSRSDNCAAALELLIDPLRILYAREPGIARSTGKTGGATICVSDGGTIIHVALS